MGATARPVQFARRLSERAATVRRNVGRFWHGVRFSGWVDGEFLAAKFVPGGMRGRPDVIGVTGKTVYCIDGRNWKIVWSAPHGYDVEGSPAISIEGKEVQVIAGGEVRRFDARTGRRIED